MNYFPIAIVYVKFYVLVKQLNTLLKKNIKISFFMTKFAMWPKKAFW